MPLIISLSLPLRSTSAVSAEPADTRVLRKPSPMDSTATSTPTTPMTPTIVATEDPRRWPMVRRLSQITTPTWESQRNMTRPPQRRSASAMRSRMA